MPKLNKTTAKAVGNSKSEARKPLPEGIYPAKLMAVEVKDGKQFPYWQWQYELIDPVEGCYTRQFVNTSLSPKALWKLEETFSGHGVAADTDTDELLGDIVSLIVSVGVIEQGTKAGELGNNVEKVIPLDRELEQEEEF